MNEPQQFKGDLLPTKLDLWRHYLYLISVKSGTKEWTQFTPLSVKIDAVCEDLASIWNKTGIPHQLTDRAGKKKVALVITKGKSLQKHMNKEKFEEMNKLFDVARCQHKIGEICTCKMDDQVLPSWKEFLEDQRSTRAMAGALNTTKLSLRSAQNKRNEIEEKREKERIVMIKNS